MKESPVANYFNRFLGCARDDTFLFIRNTNLHFLVFCASFFNIAVVRFYLTKGYVKKSRRPTFASFASLATLAFVLFLKNL
ncbi:MAG: hypothetical protein DRP56_05825 [Planctomycetota bacterium]|nr:MAG: hypothetical protein DRP56_05825 [Planctomycetota bacterium]